MIKSTNFWAVFFPFLVMFFTSVSTVRSAGLINSYLNPLPQGGGSINIVTEHSSTLGSPLYTSNHLVDGDFQTRKDPLQNGQIGGELGLDGAFIHTTDPDSYMWVSLVSGVEFEWVSFSFTDGSHEIDQMRIWNQNEITPGSARDETDRGVQDMWVWYSEQLSRPEVIAGPRDSNPGAGWNEFGQVTLSQASTLDYEGEIVPLGGGISAQHVLFMIDSNYSGGADPFVGLSEVQFFGAVGPPPTESEWRLDAGGNWNSNYSWSNFIVPNDDNRLMAIFGSAINSPRTVVTDESVTVNGVTFDNPVSYGIAGHGSVDLDMNTGLTQNPTINVVQGLHEFQVQVNLNGDTEVNIAAPSAVLEFNNRLNLNGHALTKTGAGTLAINNVLAEGALGSLNCQSGACIGSGTVQGDLANGSVVAPGSSTGVLSVAGNYTQSGTGILAIELDGNGGITNGDYDRLVVTGSATLDGTLDLQVDAGYVPTIGDAMSDILTADRVTGVFGTVKNVVINGRMGLAVTYSEIAADVRVALRGNTDVATGDVDVDTSDLTTSIINFTSANGTGKTWADGDMDGDGDVDTSDLTTSIINFTSALSGGTAAVPEPSTVVMLLLGLVGIFGLRTRRAMNLTFTKIGISCLLMFLVTGSFSSSASADLLNQYLNDPSLWVDGDPFGQGGGSTNIMTTHSSSLGPLYASERLVDGNFAGESPGQGETGGELQISGFYGHTTDPDPHMWVTQSQVVSEQFVSFSFSDGPHVFDVMRVWNQNETTPPNGSDETDRGIKEMWVWYSNEEVLPPITGGPTDTDPGQGSGLWTLDRNLSLNRAEQPPAGTYDGETVDLGDFTARHVLFMIESNHSTGGDSYVGLSAVQFCGSGSCATGPVPTESYWKNDESGDWADNSNWSFDAPGVGNTMPAIFGSGILENRTVFSDQAVSVNGITFDNAFGYVVAGQGALNLVADTPGNPVVNVVQGSHEFQIRVNLQADAEVNVAAPSALLSFNNDLDLNGNTLTKTGAGTLFINNELNLGTGGTIDCQGGVCSGGGTVGGNLSNSAIVSPGNNAGSLAVNGDLTTSIINLASAQSVSAVPEPSAMLLLLSAVMWLFGLRTRR